MPEPRRFVLAHGFTQTARSWSVIEAALRRAVPGAETVAVDLPGHGAAADLRTDLPGSADHLVATGGAGIYVGYSMGGRVCLHAALDHPDAIRGLVLIGATAGIDDDAERAARRDADERLAARVQAVGVERFVDEWLSNPLFAGLSAEAAQREERVTNTADGLASSLRLAGTGTQRPLWHRLAEIEVPTLVLAGADDPKFRTIGKRIASTVPDATFVAIDGAGHSAHLEQPGRVVEAIATWVDRGFRRR